MRALFSFFLLCLPITAVAQQSSITGSAPGSEAFQANPKFQAAMAEGAQLVRRHQFSFAASSFRKANKLADGHCVPCLDALYSAEMSSGSFKDAVGTAADLRAVVATPLAKSAAVTREAEALFASAGERPKPDKLEQTHQLLVEAVALYPKNPAALFLDGKVLAALGKLDEAKTAFSRCVSCVGTKDPARLRAEHFAENPELALHKSAPIFEVTALDGSKFNLDAMGGRVVLLDFWATWCGPCNRELPNLKHIVEEFRGQPLVVLSVSWERDETEWKRFIEKNGMTWAQYRDADHKLSDLFGIDAIPHYFTIDSDGVLTAEMLGEGANIEGKLKKLLAKAKDSPRETVATTAPPVVSRAE